MKTDQSQIAIPMRRYLMNQRLRARRGGLSRRLDLNFSSKAILGAQTQTLSAVPSAHVLLGTSNPPQQEPYPPIYLLRRPDFHQRHSRLASHGPARHAVWPLNFFPRCQPPKPRCGM